METKTRRIAVIGGGITGLAAARKLERAKEQGFNLEYDLYEKSSQLGGKIQTERKNGFVIERGPDSYLARKESMTRLAKDVGIEDDLLPNDTGQAFVLKGDRLYPIPGGAIMGIPTEIKPFIYTQLLSPLGKLRAATDFVYPSFTAKDEDISLGHFFRRRLGNEVVDNLIEPLLSGIYAGNLDKLSLKATFPQFQQVEQKHGSLIRGMKASRAKQGPKVEKTKSKGMFLTFRNGLQSFVEAIESKLEAGSVHKNSHITKIYKQDNQLHLLFKDGSIQTYDDVIVTTPPKITAALLVDYPYFSYLNDMETTTVATVAMAYKEDRITIPHDGTGFVVSKKSNHAITACTWTHKKWKHSTPPGYGLLRAYVGRPGDSAIVSRSDEEIVKAVLYDLRQVMEIEGDPEFFVVTRWQEAMPQYNVGHTFKISKIKEDLARNLPGIHLAGGGIEGIGLPDCIDQGEAAVERILKK
ncbi:protoporphyrinogen oxidase [Halalkalibacter akibai]|uniref:Coproporphyrinogen III oxidase n=1 Tax=Halalkalibacter akibai (strain ATCC 43226 / DSM 21942 / CIP 109018 / JCM 9157 / 1139) TaxID=1236973 RepID=W4QUW8_HALA3|nr:protoporphyrinogen oxidase [Halalkalibacter akibai]GAE35124.1 protoporphyrinogen IX oxidase [Halalkalibacter akibai JCM 9157]